MGVICGEYVLRRGEFMMCGLLLEACMKLGLSERDRKGVYGLGGLGRSVWCMEIGARGAVKV